jgi:hypothetical protein
MQEQEQYTFCALPLFDVHFQRTIQVSHSSGNFTSYMFLILNFPFFFLRGGGGWKFVVDPDTKFHDYIFSSFHLDSGCDFTCVYSFHCHWGKEPTKIMLHIFCTGLKGGLGVELL